MLPLHGRRPAAVLPASEQMLVQFDIEKTIRRERAGAGKALVRAMRRDRPLKLPKWCTERVCQIVLYADGHEISRNGYQYQDGTTRWAPWVRHYGDKLKRTSFEAYCEAMREAGFMVKLAQEKTVQAALVMRAMEDS